MSIKNKILHRIRGKGRGTLVMASSFYDIANRDLIDQTLFRLNKNGVLCKLSRGLYFYPKKHPIIGVMLPTPDDIALQLAKIKCCSVQISGAQAAHLLGLSQQVPAKHIYYTNAFSRTITVGNTKILFKKSSNQAIFAGVNKKAGLIIQAMRHLGEKHINKTVVSVIKQGLSDKDAKELKTYLPFLPIWMHDTIKTLAA